MELKEYIDILLKRKWVVIWSILIITFIVVVWTVMQKPIYQASVKLLVQKATSTALFSELQKLADITGASAMSNPVNTQMELIKTRPIIEETIKRLDLRNKNGKLYAYESVLKRLSVSNIKMTDIIQLDVRFNDPQIACNAANMIAEVCVEHDQKLNQAEAKQIKEFIETQIAATEKELIATGQPGSKSVYMSKEFRSSKVTEQKYIDLLQKLGEAKISEALKISNVSIVEPAVVTKRPLKPRRVINVVLAMFFGLLVGVGTAILLEYFDDSIGTAEEISKDTGLPILGTIPLLPKKGVSGSGKKKKQPSFMEMIGKFFNIRSLESMEELRPRENVKELIMLEDPNSPQAEAFRAARTNIEFVKPDAPAKTIAVTSAGPGEGKTVFVCNLAVALAQAEKEVLLVDGDMRSPQIHYILNMENKKGFSGYLQGAFSEKEIIQATKIDRLSVITAGRATPNPSELIESKRLPIFLKEMSEKYDFILFDTPPVNLVTDAALLGAKVDGTILVLDSKTSIKSEVIEAKRLLSETQSDILGLVLTRMEHGKKHYYSKYYKKKD